MSEENDPLPTLEALYVKITRLEKLIAFTLALSILNFIISLVTALW